MPINAFAGSLDYILVLLSTHNLSISTSGFTFPVTVHCWHWQYPKVQYYHETRAYEVDATGSIEDAVAHSRMCCSGVQYSYTVVDRSSPCIACSRGPA